MVLECDNKDILELPTDHDNEILNLKVIGSGEVQLIAYTRYNPTLKNTYNFVLGN